MARPRKQYRLLCDGETVAHGDIYELSAKTGRTLNQLRSDLKYGPSRKQSLIAVNLGKGEYVLYEGEEIVGTGTTAELAKAHNVKPATIHFYSNPAHLRRVKVKKIYELVEEDAYVANKS